MNIKGEDKITVERKLSYEQADRRLTRLNQIQYYLEEQGLYDHRWEYLDGLTDMLSELLEESTDDRYVEESYFYRYPRLSVKEIFDMAIKDYYVENKQDIETNRKYYKKNYERVTLYPFVDLEQGE